MLAIAVFVLGAILICTISQSLKPPTPFLTVTNSPTTTFAHTNRLAHEKSPYLLQHQHNPVDWQPWGAEAFAQAQRENKPILLSIGYSTCHWCHVMERESFVDEKIGRFLNDHFVSIKVDREERPDVDKIYMTFAQSTTGGGGWPLNCFLTPELKPFYAGTYFPPENKYGRPSFLDLLTQINDLWQTRRADLEQSAADLHARLEAMNTGGTAGETGFSPALLTNAAMVLLKSYDAHHGGFGGAPKFPQPGQPSLLLRYGARAHDEGATHAVLNTCDHMAAGGIYDQLGGGFSRYSVDAEWLVPHFEKMLYDNAQLLDLYLDAYLVSGEARYAATARGIINYVLQQMTDPQGGFYSAEDADSEGKEGKFYCWTRHELSHLLTPEEFNVTTRYYGVTEAGNFVDHSDPSPLPNQSILSIVDPQLPPADAALLESARQKLLTARSHRVRPHLDDKVLASWNGLMLGALARAYAILGDQVYLNAAEKNFDFIESNLWDAKTATLYHRWRDGERDSVQLQSAYAFLLSGTLELYQATLQPRHLEFAIALAESMIKRFHDSHAGGFWQSADTADLIMRVKDDYDGAEPSGNSVATLALLKLAAITGRQGYAKVAQETLRWQSERLHKFPQALPCMLAAVDFSLQEPTRIVIAGDPKLEQTQELIHAAQSLYRPNKIVLGTTGPVDEFTRTFPARDTAAAYICTGQVCLPPVHTALDLKRELR